ncbi:AAA domain-containing protein [Janibacter sp. G1551]|uniref:AAA domain-containing protein n=1 Tax=Janibacter sp. G1551 TaxID=3420440 RepID=UPI003D03FBB8
MSPSSPIDGPSALTTAVAGWRRELAALGGPNSLLWFQPDGPGVLDVSAAHPGGVAMLLAGRPTRLSDLVREPETLARAQDRATLIREHARATFEDRGLQTCYFAAGRATWFLRGGHTPQAPVLIRRCTLTPVDAAGTDHALDLDPHAEVNPVLLAYLEQERGLVVDAAALSDLARQGEGFNPEPVYDEFRRLCADMPGFVIARSLCVTTFPREKATAVGDLSELGSRLGEHPVIRALTGDTEAATRVAAERIDTGAGDASRDVLDADEEHQGVIDAVRDGRHVAVTAPPGTAPARLVANLIADAVAADRRVLLVTEQTAVIDDVRGQLEAVGLADLLWHVQDPSAAFDPRTLTERWAGPSPFSVLSDSARIGQRNRAKEAARLLDDHVRSLHQPRRPWGVSAHQVQNAITDLARHDRPPHSRVRLRGEVLARLDRDRKDEVARVLAGVAARGAWSADGGSDPWFGSRLETPEDAERAIGIVETGVPEALARLRTVFTEVFAGVPMPDLITLADHGRVLGVLERVRESLEIFRPEVFDQPLDDLVAATSPDHSERPGLLEAGRLRRQARGLLRPGTPPADLHAALAAVREQRRTWQRLAGGGGRPRLPDDIDRAHEAYSDAHGQLVWLGERVPSAVAAGDLLETPLADLETRLAVLAARPERARAVPGVLEDLAALDAAGLTPVVETFAQRGLAADDVADELDFVWWTSIGEEISRLDPRLGEHDGKRLRSALSDYVAADHQALRDNAIRLRERVTQRASAVLAEGVLEQQGVRAARDVALAHRDGVTEIAPVWAVSPAVVASVLAPQDRVDLVILDDASRLTPARAASAIARATQVVVIGDEAQLPPTSYAIGAGEPEEPEAVGPSLVDVLAPVLTHHRLTRLDDMDLAALAPFVVDRYDGDLRAHPHARRTPGPRLHIVVPSPTTHPTPTPELAAVVDLVRQHARRHPSESLAVLTLHPAQTAAVTSVLERAAAQDPALATWLSSGTGEGFVVRTVDRFERRRRDAVIVTLGIERTEGGVLSGCGPITADRGAARVLIAATAARRRTQWVSSVTAADVGDAPDGSGLATLRRLLTELEGAAQVDRSDPDDPAVRPMADGRPGPRLADVDDSEDALLAGHFADRLEAAGLRVHRRFAAGGDVIDIAVEDPRRPGRMLVAIDLDGPDYARPQNARERDRLRPEALARRGWRHVRIWSTDLFRDPAREEARVFAVVHELTGTTPISEDPVDDDHDDAAQAQPTSTPRRRPEQTSDDTDSGWGERGEDAERDRWILEQRPPHWD